MNKSKMTSACNESFYVCLFLFLVLVLLNQFSYPVLVLFIVYVVFTLKKSTGLFIVCMVLSGLMYVKFTVDFDAIHTNLDKKLSCKIISIPEYRNNKHHFYCRSRDEKVIVAVSDQHFVHSFQIGQQVKLNGVATRIRNNSIPNQFNFATYYLSKRVIYRFDVEQFEIIRDSDEFNYILINHILKYYDGIHYKSYPLSLLVGTKTFDDDLKSSMNDLNISHLFVVSGFHVGFLYLIFKKILKHLKFTTETSDVWISVILFIFLIINNFAVSILRAVLFIDFVMIKNNFRLKISNIHLLSIVCILNLFINPFIIFNPGFQLSYLIAFILLLGHKLLEHKNKWVALYKISFLAQLFAFPITSNFEFKYNFLSVMVSPLLSIYYTYILFPLSILLVINKKLEIYFEIFFIFFEKMLYFLDKINYLEINTGAFNTIRYILYYFCLIMILIKIENKKRYYHYGIGLILIAFFFYTVSPVDEVTYLDVGQGDSTLIRSNVNSCHALIDTGGTHYSSYHPGQRNVIPYLDSIQVRQLDYLFISHGDVDHAGDYQFIINHIKIKNIVLNQYDQSDLTKEIMNIANKKKINVIQIDAYDKIRCGNLIFHVLNPLNDNNTSNDNSLVLFFVFNREHFLFTGDISTPVEEDLMKHYQFQIDYLKVSHHGSKHATSEAFLKHFMVKKGIISVGVNHYNHPTDEVLNRLKQNKITYYRTDKHGTITVKYYTKIVRIIKNYSPYNISAHS